MAEMPKYLSKAPESKNGARSAVIPMDGADVLTDVLADLGLSSRLFCHSELTAPWGLAFAKSSLAHFHYIERGGAWLRCDALPTPLAMGPGDLMVVNPGVDYSLSDAPRTKVVAFDRVLPRRGGDCVVFQHGGSGAGSVMLCGSFAFARDDSHPLLKLLPPVLHMPTHPGTAGWLDSTLRQLSHEATHPSPGSQTLVSRLTDVLFIQVIRTWLERSTGEGAVNAGNWLTALNDPVVGRALSLLHGSPQHRWTVPVLADSAGLSRSAFTSRFHALVGSSPKNYLKRLRLRRAAAALARGRASLRELAEAAGYESEAAFSKAFSLEFSVSPGRYRSMTRATVRTKDHR